MPVFGGGWEEFEIAFHGNFAVRHILDDRWFDEPWVTVVAAGKDAEAADGAWSSVQSAHDIIREVVDASHCCFGGE